MPRHNKRLGGYVFYGVPDSSCSEQAKRMTSDTKEVEISLKVYINKEKTKVLFAEVDTDFADVLISFLCLPLGKIVKVLEKQYGNNAPVIGSLTTLYNGLMKPEMVDLLTQRGKQVLHNPISKAKFSNLKISVDYALPSTYKLGEPYNALYTRNTASFLISDDLLIVPNMTESVMQTLGVLGIDITDMQGAEMRNIAIGSKEVIDLLKGSLISRTPLSDLILDMRLRQTKVGRTKSESGISLPPAVEEATCKAMILKVMFQKSTNKLLFAQAKDDFVDFLCSMLNVSLGRVERFLGGNTCLANIDNLNRSLAYKVKHTLSKCRFTRPEAGKTLYSLRNFLPPGDANSSTPHQVDTRVYVEGSGMFMVTDDLTVTRLSLSSTLTLLDHMKISVSDVEEVELQIGFHEALSVLKASLTSTCALTDGLVNPKLKKQPVQILKILNKVEKEKDLGKSYADRATH